MQLGTIIRQLRKAKGYNQTTFAELCQITPSYLSQIETGAKEAGTTSKLQDIADKLEMPLPILMWLSLQDSDVAPEKIKAWKLIKPSVDAMICNFFDFGKIGNEKSAKINPEKNISKKD